ncbi:hypothetical protein [Gracilibacillus xinjiangensis]|uniref:Uncharacterized protein n=1 Tax=Gracilibacillus xinjiangensis TaxID=1193282 RepID=A0ABV8WVK5_9BACI
MKIYSDENSMPLKRTRELEIPARKNINLQCKGEMPVSFDHKNAPQVNQSNCKNSAHLFIFLSLLAYNKIIQAEEGIG